MTERVAPRRRGSYGIDAPYAPAFLAGLALLYLVLGIVTGSLVVWLVVPFLLAVETSYLYTTLRGKFVVWAELLADFPELTAEDVRACLAYAADQLPRPAAWACCSTRTSASPTGTPNAPWSSSRGAAWQAS